MSNLNSRDRLYLHAPAAASVLSIDIAPAPPESLMAEAIAAAVALHPSLNRAVSRDTGATYREHAAGYTLLAAEMDGDEDWMDVTLEQQREPLDVENGELARFILLESVDKTRLITMMHRLAGDGDSLAQLVFDILDLLGGGKVEATDNLYEATPPRGKLPLVTRSMINMMNKRWNQSSKTFDGDSYAAMFETYWNRDSELFSGTLDDAEAVAFAERCAAENATVESAIVTALMQSELDGGDMAVCKKVYHGTMGNHDMTVRIGFTAREGNFWDYARMTHKSLAAKFGDADAAQQVLLAMDSMSPTILDAAWYSAYAGYADLMAGQARDLLGINSPKTLGIVSLSASLRRQYGAYSVSSAWFVPPPIEGSEKTVGIIILGSTPHITMQVWADDETRTEQGRLVFFDAMDRVRENV